MLHNPLAKDTRKTISTYAVKWGGGVPFMSQEVGVTRVDLIRARTWLRGV
jgi:hypothetical protein